jgi:hypothetical protein
MTGLPPVSTVMEKSMKRMLMIALALAALPAAASAQVQGTNLAGLWRFDMTSPQGATTLGAMTVLRNKDSGEYEGKVITNGGVEALPIRSIQIQSRRMTMEVESPRGLVVFRGGLGPSGQSFSGTLTYHDGRDFSMAGVKQQAPPPPSPGRANP